MKKLLIIGFLVMLLTACRSNNSTTIPPTEQVLPTETLSPQLQARQIEVTTIWENSGHAHALAPVNCDICHETENGMVIVEVAWKNQQTGQYEAMTENNSLCNKCHEDAVAGKAHAGYLCIDCHDPHSTKASCTASGCHSNNRRVSYELHATPTGGHPNTSSSFCGGPNCHSIATAIAEADASIHGPAHALVSCMACHDASQLQARPSEDGSAWILWQGTDVNGEVVYEPYLSHNIQLEVDCARCHFENNPWELNLVAGNEFNR